MKSRVALVSPVVLVLSAMLCVAGGPGIHLKPVDNPTYEETCGACHFAYQPELLPSGSWEKILAGLPSHNGEAVEVDAETLAILVKYLAENAGEHSAAKRAVKIMSSLGGATPTRITQTPYIIKKHDDISPAVFARVAIGSRSNCVACHTTAEQGNYEDENVVIPR